MAADEQEFSELETEEEEPSSQRRLPGLTRWLIAFGMILVFITLTLVSQTIQDTTLPLTTEVAAMRATLTAAPQPLPAREEIGADMLQFRQNASALNNASGTLTASHVTWPQIINRLADYNASQVFLTGIAQQPSGQIIVSGQAVDENVVINYTDRLRQSDQFSGVVVQSITLKSVSADGRSSSSSRGGSMFPGRDQYAEFVFSVTLSGKAAS